MIQHGDIVWVDFATPRGSQPAKVRPAVVMQADWLLATTVSTVLVVPLTSHTELEAFPGNVLLPVEVSGLDKDSVVVVTQIGPVSREYVDPYPAGRVPGYLMSEIAAGIRLAMSM